MLRRILRCDICGDTWDITDTDLNGMIYPGMEYIYKRVREGVRRFHFQTIEVKSDDKTYREDMDICDKCYNKLDRFIYDLTYGEDPDMKRLHDMLTGGSSD